MSNIHKKIVAIMSEIGSIQKSQKNTMQGYMFRGIDDFLNALHPLLIKNGVFMAPRVTSCTSELKEVVNSQGKTRIDKHVSLLINYDFVSDDGSVFSVGPIPSEGLDTSDKATNKALSAALKYALIQMFAVPTADNVDADRESPQIASSAPKVSEAKIRELYDSCKEKGWDKDQFMNYIYAAFKKRSVKELTLEEVDFIIKQA